MIVNTPEEAGVTANTAGEQPTPESGTARRTRANGEQSRQRILDAATEVATERGYEGATISLVSKKSGLPPTSIYWHFTDKDDLIAAVIERSFQRWLAALELPSGRGPASGRSSWGRRWPRRCWTRLISCAWA